LFKVKITRGSERRSVVTYNFCLCGEAYPDPVRVEAHKILLFIDKHQIINFEINRVVENTQEGISDLLKDLISFELTDEIQIKHIFDKAISIYNYYNGDTINYNSVCSPNSGS